MATDELITDVANRLGPEERDQIARRKAVYSAKNKRGLVVVLIWSVAYLVILCLVAVVLLDITNASIDDMAGDISHIWGLFVAFMLGDLFGGRTVIKNLFEKITEGCLNE